MDKTRFSLEVFPPKIGDDLALLYSRLSEFAALSPDFISVTYGTDGSTTPRTLEICKLVEQLGIPSIAHLTCMALSRAQAQEKLDLYASQGVNTILALRGDKREGINTVDFKYATDLIEFINGHGGFSIAAACYSEGHPESATMRRDLEVMKAKADLGVQFFISQLFFDNERFLRFRDAVRAMGVYAPIEAGIMPITTLKQLTGIVKVSGVEIPLALKRQIQRFENNPQALRQVGLNFALQQISELLACDVDGIHLYCMNSPYTAQYIKRNIEPLL